jgi:hypothetical protein
MLAYVSFSLLLLLAAAHSGLGEAGILRPLFASRWRIEGVPRGPAERILRFAWHLTSLAWVGLACAAIGAGALQVVAVVCGLSGLVILAMLRGHLAWPLFLVAGGAAWAADGSSPLWVWSLLSWSAAAGGRVMAGFVGGCSPSGAGRRATGDGRRATGDGRRTPSPDVRLSDDRELLAAAAFRPFS